MTSKCYYITTLGAWKQQATAFTASHFIILTTPAIENGAESEIGRPDFTVDLDVGACEDSASIFAFVEADEGAHSMLERNSDFEALPHPLTQKAISSRAQSALAAQGVTVGATTFDVAEAVARIHPLLRHRVF